MYGVCACACVLHWAARTNPLTFEPLLFLSLSLSLPLPLPTSASPSLSAGLGFRPRPPEAKVESTLIWFTSGANGNWQHWKDNLDEYLERKCF